MALIFTPLVMQCWECHLHHQRASVYLYNSALPSSTGLAAAEDCIQKNFKHFDSTLYLAPVWANQCCHDLDAINEILLGLSDSTLCTAPNPHRIACMQLFLLNCLVMLSCHVKYFCNAMCNNIDPYFAQKCKSQHEWSHLQLRRHCCVPI